MARKMTLGSILANIAESEGNTREQWKAEFLAEIEENPEKVLLKECYEAACSGKKHILFKRKALPPESLETEGFFIEKASIGLWYCFE